MIIVPDITSSYAYLTSFFYAGIEEDMPDFNLDDLIHEAEAEFAPLIAESKEMAAQADKEIEKLEKELQTLDHLQVYPGSLLLICVGVAARIEYWAYQCSLIDS